MTHRAMELDPGNTSLSHSRRTSFRRCRRLYWYQYVAGLRTKELPAPLRMGSIYSDGLEAADPEVVRVAYNDLILEALHEGTPHLAERYLDEMAVVFPMVETYLAHVGLADVEREVEFVGVSEQGLQDNGRLDGLDVDAGEALIVENKLKSRWSNAEILGLNWDDQVTSYIFNVCAMLDTTPDGVRVRYEVAKKPALRQTQKETREAFRLRVSADIRSRPDFYHWVSPEPITRTQDQLDDWLIGFQRLAMDIRHEEQLEASGDEHSWPKNPNACSDYGGCSFAKVCWAGSTEETLRVIETDFTKGEQ